MKNLLIIIALLFTVMVRAQNQNDMVTDKQTIQETVAQLFIATDNSDWDGLNKVFDDSVGLDYSSMNNQPGAIISPNQIIEQWSSVLPGFDYTHHQIGNFIIEIEGETAHAFCYGTATHYLEHEKGNLWTVVGSYDFNLRKENNSWVISSMRFNYKYQTGNSELVTLAIEKQKEK